MGNITRIKSFFLLHRPLSWSRVINDSISKSPEFRDCMKDNAGPNVYNCLAQYMAMAVTTTESYPFQYSLVKTSNIPSLFASPLSSSLSPLSIISLSACLVLFVVVTVLLILICCRRDRQPSCAPPRPLRHYSRFCTRLRELHLQFGVRIRLCCARLRRSEVLSTRKSSSHIGPIVINYYIAHISYPLILAE